jgi:hypothetical protein
VKTELFKPVVPRGSIASALLQRKCVCGQYTHTGGECSERRGKRPPGSAVPLHDFGRISVHAPGEIHSILADNECAGGRFGKNGETGCDASTGKPYTIIHDPPACYRACVERHEAVHRKDLDPCCQRAGTAYKAAKNDEEKKRVQDKFDNWMKTEQNEHFLECRAYAESARCGNEYMDKNCGPKRSEGSPQGSVLGEEGPALLLPGEGGDSVETSLVSPPGRLGEEKLDEGKRASTPEECCKKVKCYARISGGRHDTECDEHEGAKKLLTPCPF